MEAGCEDVIVEYIKRAKADQQALNIKGGNSKSFYGRMASGNELDMTKHTGIVNYEPSELVITARAGTKIKDIQNLLAQNNQMLGFEPPFCDNDSTLGGVIAAGLSGPRRPYSGAVRDFMLGVKMINGKAEVLNFGGQVMKNVAGFDHSRLMAGSMGTLGVLLEISLRVVPVSEVETTIFLQHKDSDKAVIMLNQLAGRPLPISATAWIKSETFIRLSGTQSGVSDAVNKIGGDLVDSADNFWNDLKNHQLNEFTQSDIIYRVSLPPAEQDFEKDADQIIEWDGAQRWLFDCENINEIKKQLNVIGGHLTVFRGGDRQRGVFKQLDDVTMRLHQNIKQAFDPDRILNPSRMYKAI